MSKPETTLDQLKAAFANADFTDENFDATALFQPFEVKKEPAALKKWATSKGMNEDAYDDALHFSRIVRALGAVPRDAVDYADLYLRKHSLTVQFDGQVHGPRSGSTRPVRSLATLERDMRITARYLSLGYKADVIADGLSRWRDDARYRLTDDAFNAICTAPNASDADSDWLTLASAIADTSKVSAPYVVSVLKSIIWQVKRKLEADDERPVTNHVMVVLEGGQGGGKSEFTHRFFAPLKGLMIRTNFAEVTDVRNVDLWSFPVLFLDEMEKAGRSDVEAIKNAITGETRSGRVLYTSQTSTVRNRSSLWGCTNTTIGENVVDPTGLRRFAPIPFRYAPTAENRAANLPVADWNAINGVDYLNLWRSVDHIAEQHPLHSDESVLDEWRNRIEGERRQDSVEAWLRYIGETGFEILNMGGSSLPRRDYTTSNLYTQDDRGYARWCNRHGHAALSSTAFSKRLAAYSEMPWYPFEKPVRKRNGTVHAAKVWVPDPAAKPAPFQLHSV